MRYPTHILPQPSYKKIGSVHTLHNYYLIHYTDTTDNKDPFDGKVKPECVTRSDDHLRDYSNSLLGTFKIDDIYIELIKSDQKKYFYSDWQVGKGIEQVPKFREHFIVNRERGFFFLSIKECANQEVAYSDGTNVTTLCKVLHTPTNSNFWHVSLRWFYGDKDTLNMTGGERKRILLAAKAFIQEKGKFEIPVHLPIDRTLYC